VWQFVSSLLKDPERIQAGVRELIEQERTTGHGGVQKEVQFWEEKLAECSRLRSAYQDQQAAGLMTLEELGSKLKTLEQTRNIAEGELSAREERTKDLEANQYALITSYTAMVPEALNDLSGEERRTVYRMLQLEVKPSIEALEVSGMFCTCQPTGRRGSRRSLGSRACVPCTPGGHGR
jgi:hypothetical protein